MHQRALFFSLFAASVLAAPSPLLPRGGACTSPGTYTCSGDASTMEVCDLDLYLKPLVPGCPPGTACQPNPFGSNIPYCMLKKTRRSGLAARNETGASEDGGDSSSSATTLPATTSSPGAEVGATGGAGEASGDVTTRTRTPVPTKSAGGSGAGGTAGATPPPVATGGLTSGGGSCSTPNQFSCFFDHGRHGIRICDLQGQLQTVGYCAYTEHCGNIGGIPYCLASWAP